jgi:hypothetical protein
LGVRKELLEFLVDFLLQQADLLLLFGGEIELLLQEGWHDLSGAGRTTESSRAWAARAAGTTRRSKTAAPAAVGRVVGGHPRGEGDQFFFGHHAVFVDVGAVEQPEQPFVADLVSREFAVLVFIERHQSSHNGIHGAGAGFARVGGGCRRAIVSPAPRLLSDRDGGESAEDEGKDQDSKCMTHEVFHGSERAGK